MNRALLILLTGTTLWMVEAFHLTQRPIYRPRIVVQQASAVSLLSCTKQGLREYQHACSRRARNERIGR